jgi:hypothetical protein
MDNASGVQKVEYQLDNGQCICSAGGSDAGGIDNMECGIDGQWKPYCKFPGHG